MISRILTIISVVAVTLVTATFAIAATVTIIPSGGSSYVVQGSDMNGVAGIDLNISYDSSSLASPSVNQGALVSGSMFLANANNPGNIKVAIISTTPFKGSGQIATITFGSQTGSGGITGVNASMINLSGGAIAVQASVATAGNTQTPAGSTDTTTTASGGTVSSSGTGTAATVVGTSVSSSLGTVSMSSDTPQTGSAAVTAPSVPAQPETVISTQPARVQETPAAIVETPAIATAVEPVALQSTYAGIAERFRTYQGTRTPAALTGLFQQPVSNTIQQQPAIVISDGKAGFRLLVELATGSTTAPNFALSGAKMVSLNSSGPGKWVLEAVPLKNTVKASVTIVSGRSFVEYPVTVVPPITAITGKESDFAVFLKDSGAKVPKFDLNSDGRHDYLDDYIYTAHYLIKNGK